jgi:hypothetical protein
MGFLRYESKRCPKSHPLTIKDKINFGVLNGSAAFVFTYTVTPATPIIKNQTEFDLL